LVSHHFRDGSQPTVRRRWVREFERRLRSLLSEFTSPVFSLKGGTPRPRGVATIIGPKFIQTLALVALIGVQCETATVTLGHSKILVVTGLSSNLLRTLCVRKSELDSEMSNRLLCVTRAKPLDREALVQPRTTGTRSRLLLPRRSLICREPKPLFPIVNRKLERTRNFRRAAQRGPSSEVAHRNSPAHCKPSLWGVHGFHG
jgi:hypothetical protein